MATLLYNVGLSAQANQTCTASGAYTISGLTWYAKGNLAQSSSVFTRNLVNGSGLSIKCTTNNGHTLGSNGNLDFPHWFLPFSQVPGYDAAAPMLIRARFAYDALGHPNVVFGICDTTNDGTGLRAAVRAKDHFIGPTTNAGTTSLLITKLGAATPATTLVNRAGAIANNQCVVGLQTLVVSTYEMVGAELKASGMPAAPDSFLPAIGVGAGIEPFFDPGARSNPGLFFGVQDQTFTTYGVYLEQLEVYRLSAPVVIPDTDPVVLTVVSPTPGSAIARNATVTFDVTDAISEGIRPLFIVVYAQYADGTTDVIWDSADYDATVPGSGWKAPFRSQSSRSDISDGYRFTVQRTGGWRSPPTFYVHAIDDDGNLDELTEEGGGA